MMAALMALAVGAIVAFDQWVKFWVVENMELHESMGFLPGLLQLYHVRNFGAAWSSFSGARWLLIGVTGVAILAMIFLLVKVVRHPLGVWSLVGIIAGGLGNLIDRVRLGYVVDMLDCLFIDFPVFNVADCFVVCGGILGAIYYVWFYDKYDAKNWGTKHGNDCTDPE